MIYLKLLFEFFKVGLFTVGGGLAALPYLVQIAEKYPWFTVEELYDMIAISESTPGPIGINSATYSGFTTAGVFGGIAATIGICIPGFIICYIVARFLDKFSSNPLVKNAFYGLRPAVCGLIGVAAWELLGMTVIDISAIGESFTQFLNIKSAVLFALMLFAVMKFKKHPVVYIGAAAVIGIIFKF